MSLTSKDSCKREQPILSGSNVTYGKMARTEALGGSPPFSSASPFTNW